MASARTVGLGMLGAAVTMLARNATRRAMHDESGTSRPRSSEKCFSALSSGSQSGMSPAAVHDTDCVLAA